MRQNASGKNRAHRFQQLLQIPNNFMQPLLNPYSYMQ